MGISRQAETLLRESVPWWKDAEQTVVFVLLSFYAFYSSYSIQYAMIVFGRIAPYGSTYLLRRRLATIYVGLEGPVIPSENFLWIPNKTELSAHRHTSRSTVILCLLFIGTSHVASVASCWMSGDRPSCWMSHDAVVRGRDTGFGARRKVAFPEFKYLENENDKVITEFLGSGRCCSPTSELGIWEGKKKHPFTLGPP